MQHSSKTTVTPSVASQPACLQRISWLTPVHAAFGVSLLLSLIARMSSLINRDGMLYVDTARIFLESGLTAAREEFNWPFLSIMMAVLSQFTGLNLENSGYLLNAFFMAGTCALLVDSARRKSPCAAWYVCLATLAIPGLNEYRNELLREYGCWFFVVLGFWLALRWSEKPNWLSALGVQVALGTAALFRPEALALFAALSIWQLLESPNGEKKQRMMMIIGPALAAFIILLSVYLTGHFSENNRLAGDLSRFSLTRFSAQALAFAATLPDYAQSQARTILFFGSLSIIPVKFVHKIGLFIVPLAFLFAQGQARLVFSRNTLFAWGAVAHLLVLAVFVTDLHFLAGRYTGLLYLMLAPMLGYGLWLMSQRFPRGRNVFLVLALLTMLANVITLSPGKTHFVRAGQWLANNSSESPRIYIESGRAAYYAGWRRIKDAPIQGRGPLEESIAEGKYDLLVLEVSRKERDIETWLNNNGLIVLQRFGHPNQDAVIIAAPTTVQSRSKELNTEHIR